ncbi:hypothetical protein HOD08_00865, partial [bacterium]|nr:hypothetical protein [bacterium]
EPTPAPRPTPPASAPPLAFTSSQQGAAESDVVDDVIVGGTSLQKVIFEFEKDTEKLATDLETTEGALERNQVAIAAAGQTIEEAHEKISEIIAGKVTGKNAKQKKQIEAAENLVEELVAEETKFQAVKKELDVVLEKQAAEGEAQQRAQLEVEFKGKEQYHEEKMAEKVKAAFDSIDYDSSGLKSQISAVVQTNEEKQSLAANQDKLIAKQKSFRSQLEAQLKFQPIIDAAESADAADHQREAFERIIEAHKKLSAVQESEDSAFRAYSQELREFTASSMKLQKKSDPEEIRYAKIARDVKLAELLNSSDTAEKALAIQNATSEINELKKQINDGATSTSNSVRDKIAGLEIKKQGADIDIRILQETRVIDTEIAELKANRESYANDTEEANNLDREIAEKEVEKAKLERDFLEDFRKREIKPRKQKYIETKEKMENLRKKGGGLKADKSYYLEQKQTNEGEIRRLKNKTTKKASQRIETLNKSITDLDEKIANTSEDIRKNRIDQINAEVDFKVADEMRQTVETKGKNTKARDDALLEGSTRNWKQRLRDKFSQWKKGGDEATQTTVAGTTFTPAKVNLIKRKQEAKAKVLSAKRERNKAYKKADSWWNIRPSNWKFRFLKSKSGSEKSVRKK